MIARSVGLPRALPAIPTILNYVSLNKVAFDARLHIPNCGGGSRAEYGTEADGVRRLKMTLCYTHLAPAIQNAHRRIVGTISERGKLVSTFSRIIETEGGGDHE